MWLYGEKLANGQGCTRNRKREMQCCNVGVQTPTNGREPDDFQPRAQIKRLFEESKSFLVAVSFTRLLGNGRLGSPKWKKQISLLNTCRPIVPQTCRFFYLGYITCTSLNSNQGSIFIYRNARGKRTVVEREVWYISSLNIISWSRNPPSQKERLLTRFQIQCGPPVLNSNLEGKRKTVQVTAGLS